MTNKRYWSKRDEEILIRNFCISKWDELLKMLPEKTEVQILSKADRLGIKREPDKIAEYYDSEEDAWVETFVHYNKIKGTVSSTYPAKNGLTLKEAKERVGNNFAKSFIKLIKPRYNEIIKAIGYQFDTTEVRKIYFEMERELFFTSDKKSQEDIKNKYSALLEEEVKKIIGDKPVNATDGEGYA
jgi:hypothetical protein